jgi:thioredoxin 1
MKYVTEVTDQTFESEVLKGELPVIVDFWAPWCGPCRMMSPVLEAAAEKLAGRMKFVKVNTDENSGFAVKFGVMAIPTLIVFQGGQEKRRMVGFLPQSELEAELQRQVPLPPAS